MSRIHKRRTHMAAFKKEVVLATFKEEKIIQQIAAEYEIHPDQVSNGELRGSICSLTALSRQPRAKENAIKTKILYSRHHGMGGAEIFVWRIEPNMTTDLCLDTLDKVLESGRLPRGFNTDQGS